MKSTTTYLEEIRKDIENVQTKEELDAKYTQWCQNLGRDVVTFFPDFITNEEGWKWLRIIGENFAEVFNKQAEKISKNLLTSD